MARPAASSWLTRWRKRHQRAARDDFGDHGTAFGLDLSLRMPDEVPALAGPAHRGPIGRRRWWAKLRLRAS